eukprot:3990617-Amphidinium_carterae.1
MDAKSLARRYNSKSWLTFIVIGERAARSAARPPKTVVAGNMVFWAADVQNKGFCRFTLRNGRVAKY